VLAETALTRLAVEEVVALLMAQAGQEAQEIAQKALVVEVAGAGKAGTILRASKAQAAAVEYLMEAMAEAALGVVAAGAALEVAEGRRTLLTLAVTGGWVYATPATVTPFLGMLILAQ
jgi:hypothetical protein